MYTPHIVDPHYVHLKSANTQYEQY